MGADYSPNAGLPFLRREIAPEPDKPSDELIARLEPSVVLKGDMDTEEAKQATERLLKVMDKGAPEGSKRMWVPLGESKNGEPLGIIVWQKEEKLG